MSGRPVAERPMQLVTDTSPSFTRAATVYGWSLALVAVAAFVALLVAGAGLPPLVPTLLLLAVLALCIVRAVLYPSEFAVTAEVGVLLCAVVAFRDVAPYTGPLLIALFAGPLDVDHWRRRSFGPMAYNSGHRALGSLAAAGAFAASVAWLGGPVGGLAAATVLAALAASVIDGCASVALVSCLGANARVTRRGILETDAIAFPLAVAGGAIGFLATGVGWWAAGLALVALALVPELLQARARIPARVVRDALLAAELVVTVAVLALVATPPSWSTAVALVVLAVVVGRELVVDARVPVPPVLGIAVVLSALSVHSGSAMFAGVLVAALATATSWWSRRNDARAFPSLAAVVVAAAGGVLAVLVVTVDGEGSFVRTCLGLGAGVVFAGAALLSARERRRAEAASLLWVLPLAGIALGAPVAEVRGTTLMVLLPSAALGGAVVLAAWCGSTPWRSRLVSRRLGLVRVRGRWLVGVVLGVAGASIAGLVIARGGDTAGWLAWVGLVVGETAVTMGLFAVRQWRFVPRRRIREATALAVAALLLAALLASPSLWH